MPPLLVTVLVRVVVQEPAELFEGGPKLVHAPKRRRELGEGRGRVCGESRQPLLLLLKLPGEDERAGPPLLEEPAELRLGDRARVEDGAQLSLQGGVERLGHAGEVSPSRGRIAA